MITAKVDNRELMSSLNRLSHMTGKPLDMLVRQSARRVCVNLSRTIAPFGFGESARAMGESAVRADYKVSTETAEAGFLQSVIDITGQRKNITRTLTSKRTGKPYVIDWKEITMQPSRVYKHHQGRRSKITGRVTGGGSAKGSRDKNIGRWKANEQTVTTDAVKEKAMQKAIKRVGLAKHAYSRAALSLGGTRGIPTWVKKSRRKPMAGGTTIINTKHGHTIRIENSLPYASRLLSRSGEMSAMKREADFLKQEVARNLTRRWKS